MKIKQVDIYQLHWQGLSPVWHPVAVRLTTDTGLAGFGEAGTAYGIGSVGTVGVLQELAHRLVGKDPAQISQIWQDFYQHSFWAKGGGVVFYSAVSAIDIALWDLKGKALHQPVYQLLGGKVHDRLPAYASHIEYGWGPFPRYVTAPDDFARLAKRVVEQGYSGIKIDPLNFERGKHFLPFRGLLDSRQLQEAYERVAAIRKAAGEQTRIIVDCHAKLEPAAAIALARKLAPLNVSYFEEPISPQNVAGFVAVAQQSGLPLATGERLTNALSFAPLVDSGSIQVLQPDLGNCGGITSAVRLMGLAAAHELSIQLHVCGGPLATAAALQFEAACPQFLIHEEHEVNRKPANIASGRYHYAPVDGSYAIPDRPGIGQELSEQAMNDAQVTTIREEE